MVDFNNVCFGYGKKSTISGVSFHINKGDFVAVLGANGAGKTTLSKLFNGLLKPTSGDVIINGMNTKKTRTSVLAKTVGFLFQNPDRQICRNTIRDEIMFGLQCVNKDKAYCTAQCDKILDEFGFDGDKDPFSMSRGERQKIALASLLAVEPEILILDEPTTGLDYSECMHIMSVIKQLNEKGVTVIMVTHDMELVLDFAKRVIVLSDGTIKAFDEMRKVMKNQSVLTSAKLLPPQICDLAIKLGTGFEDIYTNAEMLGRIAERSAL